jgi:hypothetical protein
MRQGDGSEHAVTSVLAGSRIPIEALAGMGSLLSLRVRVSIPRFAKRCDRRLRFGLVWPSPSAHKNPPASEVLACGRMRDSGDDRLSRQKHYHGPGGLNGRVRNGNGCCPARMVAGNVPGRRSSAAGHVISEVGHTASHKPSKPMEWVLAPRQASQTSPAGSHARSIGCFWSSGHRVVASRGQRPDRGGQAAWLLGPVG